MHIPSEIFKAYDIRGIVGKTITEEITFKIGQAVGSEVIANGGKQIVIGRDGRLSGPMIAKELAAGLQAAGVDVVDIGVAPSPVVYYSSYKLDISSCIAITGSHNPPDYNGFKIVVDGVTLSSERIQDLRQRIEDNNFSTGNGSLTNQEIIDDYVERILSDVKPQRKLKVVIDCGNGVGGATAPQVFKGLGCEVIELFSEVDGNFPNHHPDPSQMENLEDLIKAVKENNADVGLAFDGDADRLGVITPNGDVVWADRQMILFARDILESNPGSEIIYDVKCSRNLPSSVIEAGGKATMSRTGHSFIKALIKETGAVLGGEMSGHIFFKERWYGFDDGVYAGARLIELLSKYEESPQVIFDALPDSLNTPELRIEFEEGGHYAFMEKLKKIVKFDDAEVSTIDGIRVDFSDGFGLIRASNTTPILVLRFEGDNEEALERIQQQFRVLIKNTDPDVVPTF